MTNLETVTPSLDAVAPERTLYGANGSVLSSVSTTQFG